MNKKEQKLKKRIDKQKTAKRKANTLYLHKGILKDVYYLTDSNKEVSAFYYDIEEGRKARDELRLKVEDDTTLVDAIKSTQETILQEDVTAEIRAKDKYDKLGKNYQLRMDKFDKTHMQYLEAKKALEDEENRQKKDFDPKFTPGEGKQEEFVLDRTTTSYIIAKKKLKKATDNLIKDANILKSIERNKIDEGANIQETNYLEKVLEITNPNEYKNYMGVKYGEDWETKNPDELKDIRKETFEDRKVKFKEDQISELEKEFSDPEQKGLGYDLSREQEEILEKDPTKLLDFLKHKKESKAKYLEDIVEYPKTYEEELTYTGQQKVPVVQKPQLTKEEIIKLLTEEK